MNKKELVKYFGEKVFDSFDSWMLGKTVTILPNKEIEYYNTDIEKFNTVLIEKLRDIVKRR